MGLSSEMIDQLSFVWDSGAKKSDVSKKEITSTTEVHLEEYFAFLEEVAPFFPKAEKGAIIERKVFEL